MAGAYLWGWDESTETWVKCQVTPEGKLIINPTGFLENPPTEDETKKAPTSEWAFDHAANVAAHHTKYTDAESRAAIGNQFDSTGKALKNLHMGYNSIQWIGNMIQRLSTSDAVGWGWNKMNNQGKIRYSAYEYGVGYVNAIMELYDGSAYYDVITEKTFLANFADLLENPPTEDESQKAPTSEWAYDHENDSYAHHERYYDKEAVDAFQSRDTTFTTGTIDDFDATSVSMVWLDTTDGDINLRGMKGGYSGKIVFFVRTNCDNSVYLRHAHATPDVGDRFYIAGGDKTMGVGAYGGFIAVYKDPAWQVFFGIP